MIIIIQSIDIFLNFFKIQIVDVRLIKDPIEVARIYIKGQLVSDLIAVLPWSVLKPKYIFLRFLKLRKFGIYQQYFDEFIAEMAASFLNNEQIKKLINAFRLIIQITFLSHFFANIWVLVGLAEYYQDEPTGWIKLMEEKEIQDTDFFSLYITALYWVITSFSSVGYGDVVGITGAEHIYQMLVEMFGIGFFGYMIGTFQSLIQGFRQKD